MQPVTLPVASADTGKLISAAQRGLAAILRRGYRYKKAGVLLLEPVPAAELGRGLFDAANSPAAHARMRTVDALNRRFGRDTVTYAAAGLRRAWRLRSDFISPRYTMSWDELLRV
jgi:DNA polymerase V